MKKSKRWINSALVTMLAMSSFGVYHAPLQAEEKRFRDVNAGHAWALQHITKMSIKGLVEGTPDGRFLPDQAVSQEQALAMVLRAMGAKSEAESYNGTDYTTLYRDVSDWAKGYVSVANEKGLLEIDEGDRFRGQYAASRQWIAQLLVRMINKEQEAAGYEEVASPFADSADIAEWAESYVKLAASDEYGLIKGFKNADGSYDFKPKASVTRAQLAVLISLAEKYLAAKVGEEVQGEVLSASGNELVLDTPTGQQKFSVASDISVFKDNKKVSVSSLQRYQPVLIIKSSSDVNAAAYIEILDEAVAEETITGTISKILKEFNTIALNTTEGLKTYQLKGQVIFGSKDGTVQSINDLTPNDSVEVTISGGKISKIYRLVGESNLKANGTIYDVDAAAGLVTVQKGSEEVKVYTISDATVVSYPDGRSTGLNGLRKGMEVELKLDQSAVTEIKVLTIIEEGSVISISPDGAYVTVQDKLTKKPNVYALGSNANLKYRGGAAATSSDILVSDEVLIQIGSNGSISSLEILNRSGKSAAGAIGDLIQGRVFSIDQDEETIILEFSKDGKKSYQPYDFAKVYELYINGDLETDLTDVKKDMSAKLYLHEDEIVYLEVDDRIEGTVVRVDKDHRILTIALSTGEQKPYYVNSDYDMTIRHESGEDMSDLERNDFVRVQLDNAQKVTDIEVRRDFVYLVTDVYESSKKLTVEDEDEDDYSMYLNAGVALTIPGKNNPKVADINEGDMVKATYLGDDLEAVEVLPSYRAMVTNIDANKKEFTVLKSDGTTTALSFGTGDVIKYKTSEYTQLSGLAVGDRIQVNSWLGGKKRLVKMEKLTGEFYYKDSNYVYVIEGVRSYKYSPNLIVRGDGNRGITLDSLKKNDKISMYRLDDLIYEIQKTN